MGNLTVFLQHAFREHCPRDWECIAEREVMSQELSELLGFHARADVMLTRNDRKRRLWIEFEISRADPVANHAKFGTAHIFEPRDNTEVFVSMVSSHVTRGRHNLAAASIFLLRNIGLSAFQTLLFPDKPSEEIKALNHRDVSQLLADKTLSVIPEIERAIAVSEPIESVAQHSVFLASNVLEVMLNLRQWNKEIRTADGLALWGKRTVTFFVFDPASRRFAPSKYCAFVPIDKAVAQRQARTRALSMMDMLTYAALDESETRFDGAIARNHLCRRLYFQELPVGNLSADLRRNFTEWQREHADAIRIHPRGALILQPATWWS